MRIIKQGKICAVAVDEKNYGVHVRILEGGMTIAIIECWKATQAYALYDAIEAHAVKVVCTA